MNLMRIDIYSIFNTFIQDKGFLSPEEINNEGYNSINVLMDDKVLNIIRISLIVLAIAVFIIYRYWRRNFKFSVKLIDAFFIIAVFTLGIAFLSSRELKGKEEFIGTSMNIGNALEAPRDVSWDVKMDTEYIEHIRTAGFDTVRIPVRFSDHTDDDGKLDENFMKEVDYFVNYALDRGLKTILDMHHFKEIMNEPEKYKDKFLSIWQQLGERYKDYSENLIFELLNEPQLNLKGDLWNEYLKEGIEIVRTSNKTRKIIVGGDSYNSVESLERLKLPKDKNLILAFHYYVPNEFSFQGNMYHEGYEDINDIEWNASEDEMKRLNSDFLEVRRWADRNNVPVYLGEFGVSKDAPRKSRLLWIEKVREMAEKYDFSWGYWEMASGFGIYDTEEHIWDDEALKMLLPDR